MKKNPDTYYSSNLHLILGLFVITFAFTSCKIKEIQCLSIAKVDNVKLGFQHTTADVHLKLYNPNGFEIQIDSMKGSLKQEGDLLGEIEDIGEKLIPANDSIVYPVKVHIKTGPAAMSLIQYFSTKNKANPHQATFIGIGWVKALGIRKKIKVNQVFFHASQ